MKTEGIPNPLSCFNVPMKNLSMLDIANIYSDRKRQAQLFRCKQVGGERS